jgi:hypothetical protein
LGREIGTLVDEFQKAGIYKFNFKGKDLASGIYFNELKWGTVVKIRKMVLLAKDESSLMKKNTSSIKLKYFITNF